MFVNNSRLQCSAASFQDAQTIYAICTLNHIKLNTASINSESIFGMQLKMRADFASAVQCCALHCIHVIMHIHTHCKYVCLWAVVSYDSSELRWCTRSATSNCAIQWSKSKTLKFVVVFSLSVSASLHLFFSFPLFLSPSLSLFSMHS